MSYDERVALSAAMTPAGWYVDVNTGTHASPTWTPVSGVMECKPTTEGTFKDVSVSADGGAKAEQKTADAWGLEMKLRRGPTLADTSIYDPGQEALRAKSLLYGAANLAEIRYFEVNGSGYPLGEAWTGYAAVDWGDGSGAIDDARVVEVKLKGFGARSAISPSPASV